MTARSSVPRGRLRPPDATADAADVDLTLIEDAAAYVEEWPDPEYDELTSFEVEQLEQDRDDYLDEVRDEMTVDRREAHTLGIDLDPVDDEPMLD